MLRLLGLHGRYQCGLRFAEKLSGMNTPIAGGEPGRRVTLDGFEIVFERPMDPAPPIVRVVKGHETILEILALDGPLIVTPKVALGGNKSLKLKKPVAEGNLCGACTTRAWFLASDETSEKSLNDAIQYVNNYLHQWGPFDGILGFSQGGATAASMALRSSEAKFRSPVPSFFILSGYEARNEPYIEKIHKFHIYSDVDKMIRPEKSLELADSMGGGTMWTHNLGHNVPPAEWIAHHLSYIQDKN